MIHHDDRKHPRQMRQNPKGFTLLEVMAAVAVITIVLVAVYKLQAQTIAMSEASRFYTQAPLLAQAKMAELEGKTLDELSGGSGDFEEVPGFVWEATVTDVESEVLETTAENLKRIDVTVSLENEGLSYGMSTYRWIDG